MIDVSSGDLVRLRPYRFIAVIIVVLLGVTSACSSSKSSESKAATSADGQRLITPGTLTICADFASPPFAFEENGKLIGFEAGLVEAMAPSMNLATNWIDTPFDSGFSALDAGKCDVIVSGLTITEDRKKLANFTDAYFDADQSLVVRAKDASATKNLADFAGKAIGAQAGTTGQAFVEKNKAATTSIKLFPGDDAMFAALGAGEINAIVQDFPFSHYRASKNPTEFAVVQRYPTGEQYGMAVAKSTTGLLDQLNTALAAVEADGTYNEIYNQWFGATN
ncbi:MAG: ABC transporter substrate-binding protein [Actinobacteria bacterium]|nr:ABC transporter substrate-binding protein [Actinomycetota bacterium]